MSSWKDKDEKELSHLEKSSKMVANDLIVDTIGNGTISTPTTDINDLDTSNTVTKDIKLTASKSFYDDFPYDVSHVCFCKRSSDYNLNPNNPRSQRNIILGGEEDTTLGFYEVKLELE